MKTMKTYEILPPGVGGTLPEGSGLKYGVTESQAWNGRLKGHSGVPIASVGGPASGLSVKQTHVSNSGSPRAAEKVTKAYEIMPSSDISARTTGCGCSTKHGIACLSGSSGGVGDITADISGRDAARVASAPDISAKYGREPKRTFFFPVVLDWWTSRISICQSIRNEIGFLDNQRNALANLFTRLSVELRDLNSSLGFYRRGLRVGGVAQPGCWGSKVLADALAGEETDTQTSDPETSNEIGRIRYALYEAFNLCQTPNGEDLSPEDRRRLAAALGEGLRRVSLVLDRNQQAMADAERRYAANECNRF